MLLNLPFWIRLIVLCFIAYTASALVYIPILKIALDKSIVDKPNQRKLQKRPVPVMGGIAVFFGIVVGLCFYKTIITYTSLFPVLGAMMIMLYLGAIDDCMGLRPGTRLAMEMVVAILICYGTKSCIDSFEGVLSIDILPLGVAVPLSVFAFMGIVNSINMVDGVDGLASSLSIFILACFGLYFYLAHDYSYSALAVVSIGGTFPFMFHNLFGRESKMYLGDSGTMMIATVLGSMVIRTMSQDFAPSYYINMDFSRIAFALALLSMPLADTLRLIFVRTYNHKSPFEADRNHFHHLLSDMNVSNVAVCAIEIIFTAVTIGVLFLSWHLGAGNNIQVVCVILSGMVCNWLTAYLLSRCLAGKGRSYEKLYRFFDRTHLENRAFWNKVQKFVDRGTQK
ncbi:MAG: undecaprenyl/decaprenyl-phosphate alpha-N-acetylglucosaminyl 1-phosphate transferase [Bacteroidaceae bacterium]|nr:undecaprenyl/decaprenyl-phosphate alpha-N-acetylglucosaminyl 1-phosphate transferase [Bacteroidaceae bacterium]